MPRVSDRQRVLSEVKEELYLSILMESSSIDSVESISNSTSSTMDLCSDAQLIVSQSDLEYESDSDSGVGGDPFDCVPKPAEIMELYFVMDNTRYFVDKPMTAKSRDFAENFFENLPHKLFRQMTRMDKDSFFTLVSMIESHQVFMNDSPYEQAPVCLQLAVTLDRLGHDGNGACLNHMIPTWGVSNGSLCNFIARCFTALEDALVVHLQWPDEAERARISDEFAHKGFPGCVGLIDGTLIPLSQRPKDSGECYFDTKSRYSINAQVICDDKHKILYLYTGMPGSVSDLTFLKRSKLWRRCSENEQNLFQQGQYLLGDYGYQASEYFVAAFKKYDTSVDKEDFNYCVAKARVTNEHCIGVLKSRWFSLKEIRIQLKTTKEHLWMVRWIGICARLHNYVLSRNDIWSEEDEVIILEGSEVAEEEGPQQQTFNRRRPAPNPSARLQAVMATALAFHRQPRGCLWSGAA